MIEVKIPTVGESITEVTVSQWAKQSGDYVEMDEIICELESDKATFELNAEAAGILTIKVEEGETIEIGTVVCTIDETASAGASQSAPVAKAESAPSASIPSSGGKTGEVLEMKVPTVGESITEVTIGTWMKQDGDVVELDEPIAEIESDKATFELAAETRGVLSIVAQEGDTIEIGALICKIEVMDGVASVPTASTTTEITSETPTGTPGYAAGHPSPAAAKILAEKGIPAGDLVGSGVGGRVTKEDAQAANKSAQTPTTPSVKEATPAVPATGGGRTQTRKKLTPLRKTVAKRLVSVKNETAMLTTFNEVDMKPVMDLRKKYKDAFKDKYEVGLGFMSFFIKAACQALQEWPAVNAQIDGNEIVYNDFCDVSIAVSAPKGLVVPVIRNAESLSFNQVESEVVRLAKKARDNKLSIDEMQGGTFTVTNGGIFGSMLSTPIINAPQSAILGMHNIVERPVAINGQVEIRPIMYLALSYDHRIIDGRESVSFLVRIKELLEDPARLMLGI
ncbi:MAG: 2-oxoglutarate dehydrogenase complex dihydrolipoyllysine-residue succinyltransferase [Reichenbachiella sp.]|uniref:2-oxoglutarate dehydrogenase complex dihydrolipoyllysine-residue succinyltransferase n=1 Tax=Reichenbachiella sp. TaxID=2184521 RepID=UPI003263EE29